MTTPLDYAPGSRYPIRMGAGRIVGLAIVVVTVVTGLVLARVGVLTQVVKPAPPVRIVATRETGNGYSTSVVATRPDRVVRWGVAGPLAAVGVLGLVLVCIPPRRQPANG